jgi:hypothetical protein
MGPQIQGPSPRTHSAVYSFFPRKKTLTALYLYLIIYKIFYRPAKPLIILQINIGKSTTSHEIIFLFANNSLIDIILIKESHILRITNERLQSFI